MLDVATRMRTLLSAVWRLGWTFLVQIGLTVAVVVVCASERSFYQPGCLNLAVSALLRRPAGPRALDCHQVPLTADLPAVALILAGLMIAVLHRFHWKFMARIAANPTAKEVGLEIRNWRLRWLLLAFGIVVVASYLYVRPLPRCPAWNCSRQGALFASFEYVDARPPGNAGVVTDFAAHWWALSSAGSLLWVLIGSFGLTLGLNTFDTNGKLVRAVAARASAIREIDQRDDLLHDLRVMRRMLIAGSVNMVVVFSAFFILIHDPQPTGYNDVVILLALVVLLGLAYRPARLTYLLYRLGKGTDQKSALLDRLIAVIGAATALLTTSANIAEAALANSDPPCAAVRIVPLTPARVELQSKPALVFHSNSPGSSTFVTNVKGRAVLDLPGLGSQLRLGQAHCGEGEAFAVGRPEARRTQRGTLLVSSSGLRTDHASLILLIDGRPQGVRVTLRNDGSLVVDISRFRCATHRYSLGIVAGPVGSRITSVSQGQAVSGSARICKS